MKTTLFVTSGLVVLALLLVTGFTTVFASPPAPFTPVGICHREGNGNYTSITVSTQGALNGHQGHSGDIIPAPAEGCPSDNGVTPTVTAVTPTQTEVTPTQTEVTPTQTEVTPTQTEVTPTQTEVTGTPEGTPTLEGTPTTRVTETSVVVTPSGDGQSCYELGGPKGCTYPAKSGGEPGFFESLWLWILSW